MKYKYRKEMQFLQSEFPNHAYQQLWFIGGSMKCNVRIKNIDEVVVQSENGERIIPAYVSVLAQASLQEHLNSFKEAALDYLSPFNCSLKQELNTGE